MNSITVKEEIYLTPDIKPFYNESLDIIDNGSSFAYCDTAVEANEGFLDFPSATTSAEVNMEDPLAEGPPDDQANRLCITSTVSLHQTPDEFLIVNPDDLGDISKSNDVVPDILLHEDTGSKRKAQSQDPDYNGKSPTKRKSRKIKPNSSHKNPEAQRFDPVTNKTPNSQQLNSSISASSEVSSDRSSHGSHSSSLINGYYRCEICLFKFRDEKNLIIHESNHSPQIMFECSVCKLAYFTLDKLKNHVFSEHSKSKRNFQCPICTYFTQNWFHLKEHMIIHNTDKYLQCHQCRRNLDDIDEMIEHAQQMHNKSISNSSFVENIDKEVKNTRSNKIESDINVKKLKSSFISKTILKGDFYHCNGCVCKFLKPENLLEHKKHHLNVDTPYKCSLCDFESLCAVEVKEHLFKHDSKSASVECNVCNVPLKGPQISQHAVFHINDRIYCFSCSENCETVQAYEQHLHFKHATTINNLYSCSKCSFEHFNTAMLTKHNKLYHCNEENKNFSETKTDETPNCQINPSSNKKSLTVGSNTSNVQEKATSTTSEETQLIGPAKNPTKSKKQTNDSKLKPNAHEINQFSCVFKCSKCNFECHKIDDLESHDNKAHDTSNHIFKCCSCNWTTRALSLYLQHTVSHDEDNRVFSCSYCQFRSIDESKFVAHVNKHMEKRCPYCVYRSKQHFLLRQHMTRQHKPGHEPYSCKLCPFNTHKQKYINIHCIMYHPREFSSLKLDVPLFMCNSTGDGCALCPYKSARPYDLKRHVPRHYLSGKKDIYLKRGKWTKTMNETEHRIVNKPVADNVPKINESKVQLSNSYRCSQCLFSSKNRGVVAKHLMWTHKIHGGVRNHLIVKINGPEPNDIAIKKKNPKITENNNKDSYAEPSNLNEPVKRKLEFVNGSDFNTEGFKLKITSKRLSTEQVHFSDSYTCKICFFRSSSAHSLKKHLSQHLVSDSFQEVSINVKQNCSSSKLTTKSLKPHRTIESKTSVRNNILKNENDKIWFCCSMCDKSYSNRKSMYSHLTTFHKLKKAGLFNNTVYKSSVPQTEVKPEQNLALDKGIKLETSVSKTEIVLDIENKTQEKSSSQNESKVNITLEECSKCSIHLLSKNAQITHKREGHTIFWKKPFSCTRPKCGQRFTNKCSLTRHEQRSCSYNKAVDNRRITDVSLKLEEPETTVDDEGFTCGECDFVTCDVGDLVQHMLTHSGIPDD